MDVHYSSDNGSLSLFFSLKEAKPVIEIIKEAVFEDWKTGNGAPFDVDDIVNDINVAISEGSDPFILEIPSDFIEFTVILMEIAVRTQKNTGLDVLGLQNFLSLIDLDKENATVH